jgi:hypothetical protein
VKIYLQIFLRMPWLFIPGVTIFPTPEISIPVSSIDFFRLLKKITSYMVLQLIQRYRTTSGVFLFQGMPDQKQEEWKILIYSFWKTGKNIRVGYLRLKGDGEWKLAFLYNTQKWQPEDFPERRRLSVTCRHRWASLLKKVTITSLFR